MNCDFLKIVQNIVYENIAVVKVEQFAKLGCVS